MGSFVIETSAALRPLASVLLSVAGCCTWPANAANSRKVASCFLVVRAGIHTPEGGKDAEIISIVDRGRQPRGARCLRRRCLHHRAAATAAYDFGRTGDRCFGWSQGPVVGE